MEINHLPIIKDYFSLEERLGNPPVQKALMTRALFLEILQNMHFVDNLQNLLPRNSKQDDCGNSDLSLNTYWSILNAQCTSVDFPCTSSRTKFIRKDINQMGFKISVWLCHVPCNFTCTWERKGKSGLVSVNHWSLNDTSCYAYFGTSYY